MDWSPAQSPRLRSPRQCGAPVNAEHPSSPRQCEAPVNAKHPSMRSTRQCEAPVILRTDRRRFERYRLYPRTSSLLFAIGMISHDRCFCFRLGSERSGSGACHRDGADPIHFFPHTQPSFNHTHDNAAVMGRLHPLVRIRAR